MKSNFLIGLMTIIWLLLMANIIWQGTNGNWNVEDVEKIGQLEVAKFTNQVIIVSVSEDETSLCFYEKIEGEDEISVEERQTKSEIGIGINQEKDKWKLVLETEAVIGRNGLGKTKEGDGKTPVGVFRFIKAFGILENPGAKMEYTRVDETHYWVDDSASKYYNQFISKNDVIQDWKSAEHLCEYGESYHYVLATSYNAERIPGRGSAVFLHCLSKESNVTAGCIAIPEVYMRTIMQRVDEDCVLIIDFRENILGY